MGRKKFTEEDLMEIYDLVWAQFHEDRSIITSQYHELKGLVSGSIERYATTRRGTCQVFRSTNQTNSSSS